VLGGDRLALAVEVGAAARAQITSTSATRVYRSRPEVADACQSIAVRIEENGVLEYLPDPLIPFAGARYRQDVRIDLADGAGLFWWETVAPGRLMRGEIFAYKRLCMDLDLQAAGLLIARERFRLEPGVRPLSSSARLGSYRTFATQSPRGGCHAASAAVEEPRSSFHPDLTFAGRGAILECAHPANDHDPASRRRGPSADA
jgi:urease accessory protein